MRRVAGMAVVLLAVAVCGAAPAGAKVYTRTGPTTAPHQLAALRRS